MLPVRIRQGLRALLRRPVRALPLLWALPIWFLAGFSPCAAEDRAGFRLVDPQGKPYAGVEVVVVGRSGAVPTDADGYFVLIPEPKPPFELAIFDARGALVGKLPVLDLVSRELTLEPAPLTSVTVLSGAAPSTIAPPAAAATVYSAEQAKERRPVQLYEAVADLPGAERVGSGPAAVPVLRGFDRGRTLILLDGARVTAERRAGASGTYLNPFALESIEIVRGPGSVAYGSDALGGIIHARTPRPRPDGFDGRYEVSGVSGLEMTTAALELNLPVGEGGALLFQGHSRDADDYESPAGVIPDSGTETRGGLVRGLFPAGDARITFGLQVDRGRDTGKPERDPGSGGAPGNRRVFYPIEDSERFTVGAEFRDVIGFQTLDIDGFVGRYRLVTDTEVTDAGTVTTRRADVEANDAMIRAVGTRAWGDGLFRLGVDMVARFNLEALDQEFERSSGGTQVLQDSRSIEDAEKRDLGLFAEVERDLAPKVALSAGLRGDQVETESNGGTFGDRSSSESAASGYLAFNFDVAKDSSVSVQYARGFRDPTLSDRYFAGITGRGLILGNPDLEPERTRQYDVAFRTQQGKARFAVFGYHYTIENLVERFRPVSGVNEFLFRNRGEVELRGVEVESDFVLPRQINLRATLNLAEGEVLDDGTPAASVPGPGGSLSIRQRVGRFWWRAHLSAFARDDEPGNNEIERPGFAVLDLSAGVRISDAFEARLLVKNSLDKAYPDSTDEVAPLAVGRNIAVVVAGSF